MSDRTYIQTIKYWIDSNPLTATKPVGKIHRLTIHQDQAVNCTDKLFGYSNVDVIKYAAMR